MRDDCLPWARAGRLAILPGTGSWTGLLASASPRGGDWACDQRPGGCEMSEICPRFTPPLRRADKWRHRGPKTPVFHRSTDTYGTGCPVSRAKWAASIPSCPQDLDSSGKTFLLVPQLSGNTLQFSLIFSVYRQIGCVHGYGLWGGRGLSPPNNFRLPLTGKDHMCDMPTTRPSETSVS